MSKMPPELVHAAAELGRVALEIADHAGLRRAVAAAPRAAAATANDSHATQSPTRV
jgi:hypothetical protein